MGQRIPEKEIAKFKFGELRKSEVNEGEKSEKETSVCVNFGHY